MTADLIAAEGAVLLEMFIIDIIAVDNRFSYFQK